MSDLTDRIDEAGRWDEIIDVRTPAEFADDHVPGAINLPVLSDAERAVVGTIYVQESRLKARRLGAALVARNIATHLEGPLNDKPGSYAPLIYCWRGGQRSLAMATVLSQVGWRPSRLAGGYKTYRRAVMAALYDGEPLANLVLLDGYTGSAKTEILGRLAALGVQTLDLEGMAAHRGSLFGGLGQPQPSQKRFESALFGALSDLDPGRPIVVEAESSKIGQINLPPVLWAGMTAAPRIEIDAPAEARARYLLAAYGDIAADPRRVSAALAALPGRHGRGRLAAWQGLLAAGDLAALVATLMEFHYDPAYERSRRRHEKPPLARLAVTDLLAPDQEDAARKIAQCLAARETPP
ncbi:MAG TPA: tRNA 2-selenouridine(34) synthase MnmH [Caulobacteraceae bacterium]|jgi:tRNA 2-selenouridine synthase|nr:tRNA 2-selenouridine(34) synthase MnmH [Caulobacteraceae bacterium]